MSVSRQKNFNCIKMLIFQARYATNALREETRQRLERVRRIPKWILVLHKIYHQYGLKHLLLIAVLIAYQFIGAAIFYFCEVSFDETKELTWKENVQKNRSVFIQRIIPTMFNNTEFLFFLTANQTAQVLLQMTLQLL